MSMLCPKCHSLMHAYERNGVVVDQCTECRGIFLDRGELEHLVDAEARFNRGEAPRAPAPPAAAPPSAYPPAAAYPPAQGYPPAPNYASTPHPASAGATTPGRSPMADLSTIASIATEYLGKGKGKKKGKKGNKSFIDGLFG
jgi:Zn-finger nucleic acid-binding protein